jgi:predicted DsbA family dithiol-disulfide isomerase
MWGIEGTVLLDESGDYARSLGVRGVPTNLVVDADGTVRAFGVSRLDELYRAIDNMLGR